MGALSLHPLVMLCRRNLHDKEVCLFSEQLGGYDINLSFNYITLDDGSDAEWPCFVTDASILNLSHNQIKVFSLSTVLPTLKYLNLSHNQINYINDNVFHFLPNLEVLHLEGNRIEDLPSSISALKRLRTLGLGSVNGCNPVRQLPLKMINLKELRVLECSGCLLEQYPAFLTSLPLLEMVNLSGNIISKIPNNFAHNSRLTSIDLSRNALYRLPEDVLWPTSLKFLDLTFNKIEFVGKRTFQTLPENCSMHLAGNPCISPSFVPAKQVIPGQEITLLSRLIRELDLKGCCYTRCIRGKMEGQKMCADCPLRYGKPGGKKWCIDRIAGHGSVLIEQTVCSFKCLDLQEGEQVMLHQIDLELD